MVYLIKKTTILIVFVYFMIKFVFTKALSHNKTIVFQVGYIK